MFPLTPLPWANQKPPASLVAPRRESISRLEATISRFPLRTWSLAANQSRDQPQSISECPGLKAPMEPQGVGARSCPGNPKPSLIIVLAFATGQTGPPNCGLAQEAEKAPQAPELLPKVHQTPSRSGCGYKPDRRPLWEAPGLRGKQPAQAI